MKVYIEPDLPQGLYSHFKDVQIRISKAEYAAAHVCDNPRIWTHYYAESSDDSRLISDLKQMMNFAGSLLAKNSELRYRLEAAGIDPDKEKT